MKVLVTGATGFIGKKIVEKLLAKNHQVVVLTRNPQKSQAIWGDKVSAFAWNSTKELVPTEALSGIDGVINLVGENIAEGRWTESQKQKIYDSRILSTKNLMESFVKLNQKPVIISTSAIGVYGPRDNELVSESTSVGAGFLANVCDDWERVALDYKNQLSRLAIIRVGVVLGREGGMMKKLLPVFKMGFGGPIGDGKQWMSWIHVDDLANLYLFALENSSVEGIINGVSPYPLTNKAFTKAFSKAVKRPALFKVPPIALKIMMGQMSCIAIDSQKIVSERLKMLGFNFEYSKADKALENITA